MYENTIKNPPWDQPDALGLGSKPYPIPSSLITNKVWGREPSKSSGKASGVDQIESSDGTVGYRKPRNPETATHAGYEAIASTLGRYLGLPMATVELLPRYTDSAKAQCIVYQLSGFEFRASDPTNARRSEKKLRQLYDHNPEVLAKLGAFVPLAMLIGSSDHILNGHLNNCFYDETTNLISPFDFSESFNFKKDFNHHFIKSAITKEPKYFLESMKRVKTITPTDLDAVVDLAADHLGGQPYVVQAKAYMREALKTLDEDLERWCGHLAEEILCHPIDGKSGKIRYDDKNSTKIKQFLPPGFLSTSEPRIAEAFAEVNSDPRHLTVLVPDETMKEGEIKRVIREHGVEKIHWNPAAKNAINTLSQEIAKLPDIRDLKIDKLTNYSIKPLDIPGKRESTSLFTSGWDFDKMEKLVERTMELKEGNATGMDNDLIEKILYDPMSITLLETSQKKVRPQLIKKESGKYVTINRIICNPRMENIEAHLAEAFKEIPVKAMENVQDKVKDKPKVQYKTALRSWSLPWFQAWRPLYSPIDAPGKITKVKVQKNSLFRNKEKLIVSFSSADRIHKLKIDKTPNNTLLIDHAQAGTLDRGVKLKLDPEGNVSIGIRHQAFFENNGKFEQRNFERFSASNWKISTIPTLDGKYVSTPYKDGTAYFPIRAVSESLNIPIRQLEQRETLQAKLCFTTNARGVLRCKAERGDVKAQSKQR